MSPDVMLTIIKVAAVFVAVSFVVFWVGLVWWVSQDVLTRTKDKIIVSAAVGLTAILGPVGILIYLVVRPRQTLKERFGEMMEQEMMLQASAITICPTCERMAQDDFLACPHCGTILKKPCTDCGKLLAMDWDHCPFCSASQQSAPSVEVTEVIIQDQPDSNSDGMPQLEDSSYPMLSPSSAPQNRRMVDMLRSWLTLSSQSVDLSSSNSDQMPSANSRLDNRKAKKSSAHSDKAHKKSSTHKVAAKKERSSAKKR